MVNDVEEAIAAFVAMPETRQTPQPKELIITNIDRKEATPRRKIGLPLNSLFSRIIKATTVSPLPSVLTVFQSLLPHKYLRQFVARFFVSITSHD